MECADRSLISFVGIEVPSDTAGPSRVRVDRRPVGPSTRLALANISCFGDLRSGSVKRVAAVGEGAYRWRPRPQAFLAEAGDRAALSANAGKH